MLDKKEILVRVLDSSGGFISDDNVHISGNVLTIDLSGVTIILNNDLFSDFEVICEDNCIIQVLDRCIIYCGNNCTIISGNDCTIFAGDNCIIKSGERVKIEEAGELICVSKSLRTTDRCFNVCRGFSFDENYRYLFISGEDRCGVQMQLPSLKYCNDKFSFLSVGNRSINDG
jgi:hypothetical protein